MLSDHAREPAEAGVRVCAGSRGRLSHGPVSPQGASCGFEPPAEDRASLHVPGRPERGGTATPASLIDNLQALAAVDGVEDRQLGRALIQRILSEELGSDLMNEAKFQLVVDQVTDALRSEPATAGLLSRILGELRAAAG